jgi:hypothetical protein
MMSVRACPPRQRARAGGSAGSNYTPPYQTTCIQVVQCTGRGASNNCGFAREKRGSGMPHHTCSRQAGRTTWLPPPRVLRRCLFRPTDRMKMNPPHDTIGECVRVASEQLRPNGGWERTVAGARAGIFASTLVHCLVGYPASSPPKTSPFVERRRSLSAKAMPNEHSARGAHQTLARDAWNCTQPRRGGARCSRRRSVSMAAATSYTYMYS